MASLKNACADPLGAAYDAWIERERVRHFAVDLDGEMLSRARRRGARPLPCADD
jgi:hypothetical protein